MARPNEQTNLRVPQELKGWLHQQAKAAKRSLTAEVVLRLEESRARQGAIQRTGN